MRTKTVIAALVMGAAFISQLSWAEAATSDSASDSATQSGTSQAEAKPKTEKPWNLALISETYFGMQDDILPFNQYWFDARYKIGSKGQLRLLQGAQQLFEVNAGDSAFQVDDTNLFYYHTVSSKSWPVKMKARAGITAPTSEFSQTNGVSTKASLMLQFSKSFFDKRFTLAYWPTFRYHFNQFTTTVDGAPLRESSIAQYLVANVEITEKLGFGFYFIYSTHFAAQNQIAGSNTSLDSGYWIEPYLSYQVIENAGIRAGFRQSDAQTKNGTLEFQVYDPEVSRVYMALDVKI